MATQSSPVTALLGAELRYSNRVLLQSLAFVPVVLFILIAPHSTGRTPDQLAIACWQILMFGSLGAINALVIWRERALREKHPRLHAALAISRRQRTRANTGFVALTQLPNLLYGAMLWLLLTRNGGTVTWSLVVNAALFVTATATLCFALGDRLIRGSLHWNRAVPLLLLMVIMVLMAFFTEDHLDWTTALLSSAWTLLPSAALAAIGVLYSARRMAVLEERT